MKTLHQIDRKRGSRENGLQDKNAKTMINPDAKLKAVLGKPQVSMFEMTKIISGHLK